MLKSIVGTHAISVVGTHAISFVGTHAISFVGTHFLDGPSHYNCQLISASVVQ